MPALRSSSARAWRVASVCALGVVYWPTGRMRSAGGAASAATPVSRSSARTTATTLLPLKNLFLADGDRLAPPTFVPGQGDVLARDLGRTALGVADRKSTRLNSSHIPLSRMPS